MNYEMMYILDGDIKGSVKEATSFISELVKKHEGRVSKEDFWGKRKFAYPINLKEDGVYVVLYFEMAPKNLKEFEKELKLKEGIVRYMIGRK